MVFFFKRSVSPNDPECFLTEIAFHFFPIFSPPPEPPLIRNNFITIAHEGKDSIF